MISQRCLSLETHRLWIAEYTNILIYLCKHTNKQSLSSSAHHVINYIHVSCMKFLKCIFRRLLIEIGSNLMFRERDEVIIYFNWKTAYFSSSISGILSICYQKYNMNETIDYIFYSGMISWCFMIFTHPIRAVAHQSLDVHIWNSLEYYFHENMRNRIDSNLKI